MVTLPATLGEVPFRLEPVSKNLVEPRGRSRLARRLMTAVHITRALHRRR